MTTSPDWVLFVGRFHPLLVHVPIGLLVLLGALEVARLIPRFSRATASTGYILALAAPAAVLAAVCGWLLSREGGYDAALVSWHQWTGFGTAAATVLAAGCYAAGWRRCYRVVLTVAIGVLVAASHFGGSLTHGKDYLTRYAPGFVRRALGEARAASAPGPAVPLADRPVYAGVVAPILKQYCVECHGPEKVKGKLRLDSMAALTEGGGTGPVVVAGKASDSRLIQRLEMPDRDEDHMPPSGKPQPTPRDVELLRWWINAGLPVEPRVREIQPPAPGL